MTDDELRAKIREDLRFGALRWHISLVRGALDELTDIALRHVREARQQEGAFDTQGATTETP